MTTFTGWIPDRDLPFAAASPPPPTTFRAAVPHAWKAPLKVLDQGPTSSCSGHAGASACSGVLWRQRDTIQNFSPWWAYRWAQTFYGSVSHPQWDRSHDNGSSIESVWKAANAKGLCRDTLCLLGQRPSDGAEEDALTHQVLGKPVDVSRWQDLVQWVADRRPVTIGTVWTSGMANCSGDETRKVIRAGSFLGYHARCIAGMTDDNRVWCINSHGGSFGDGGWTRIDQEAWETLAEDRNFVAIGFAEIEEGDEPAPREWLVPGGDGVMA